MLHTPGRMLATLAGLFLLVVVLPILLAVWGLLALGLVVLGVGLFLSGLLATALLPARRR